MVFFYLFIFVCIVLEMFPISSSGHLQLLTNYFQLVNLVPFSDKALSLFSDLLHFPIAIVLFLFFLKIVVPAHTIFNVKKDLLVFIIIADSITCLFYVLLKQVHIPNYFLPFGFVITGLILLSLYFVPNTFVPNTPDNNLTIRKALLFGLIQGISLLPGISRFASTFALGRWLGFTASNAFVLSFVIQWPLLLAASAKALLTFLFSDIGFPLLCGSCIMTCLSIVFAMGVSWFCLQWVYALCIKGQLWWFSLYMLVPLISWILLNF